MEKTISINTRILVVGCGVAGREVASGWANLGHEVLIVDRRPSQPWSGAGSKVQILAPAALESICGHLGSFQIEIKHAGQRSSHHVGAVVFATGARGILDLKTLGLEPSDNIFSLMQFEEKLKKNPAELRRGSERPHELIVAIVLGLSGLTGRPAMSAALECAIQAKSELGARVYVICDDLNLSDRMLSHEYDQARDLGVVFFKCKDHRPILENISGRLHVTVADDVLKDHDSDLVEVVIEPDFLVIEEQSRPSEGVADIVRAAGAVVDDDGFLRCNNVHFQSSASTKRGIYSVGSCRLPDLESRVREEARSVVTELNALIGTGSLSFTEDRVIVDRRKCALCLTCVRVCPHGAVDRAGAAEISPISCMACGSCAGDCPGGAIALQEFNNDKLDALLESSLSDLQHPSQTIIAFACENSAVEAIESAQSMELSMPEDVLVIPVPCAGSVDANHILRAFERGAGGVMILACHEDSCHFIRGGVRARLRLLQAKRLLQEAGISAERVQYCSVAPNMPREVVDRLTDFERMLAH